jgi:transposase
MEAMAKHHTYSIEFKRQVAQEYIAGETLHALAKRTRIEARNMHVRPIASCSPTMG